MIFFYSCVKISWDTAKILQSNVTGSEMSGKSELFMFE